MDTARALPTGEMTIAGGVGGGYQSRGLISYQQVPTPELEQADATATAESGEWPWVVPIEYFIRGMIGIGAGFQLDLSLTAPTPAYGVGGALGLKWEAPLDTPIALALLTRGSAQEWGGGSEGGRRFIITEADGGLLFSAHYSHWRVVPYLSPRLRVSKLSLAQEGWRDVTGFASSYLCSLGIKLPSGIFFESALQYAPNQGGATGEALRVTFGVGFSSR